MNRYIIVCLAFIFSLHAAAQKGTIKGSVYDPIREVGLAAKIELLSSDSSLIQEQYTWWTLDDNGRQDMKAPFWFRIGDVQGGKKYIVKIESDKYETKYIHITADFSNRDNIMDLGEVWMTRETSKVETVIVQGTRLLMVNKGDTTIYNVAALVTTESDMLGDLIQKLPGAELRDGKIYVNGKYIDKLLISGKDFFNGDISMALHQLPAYTVGKIKTYEMQGDASELTGHDMGDKQFVMDVIMKKQYFGQKFGEIVLAGGTNNRFKILGRLFYFDDQQSFGLVGETNNLGQSVHTFNSSQIWMNNNPVGNIYERSAYANYRFEPNRNFKFGMSGSVQHKREHTFQRTSVESYLESSNNYNWSYNQGRAVETTADIRLTMDYKPMKSLKLEGTYDFSFQKNYITDFSRSFSTLDNPDGMFSASSIDTVFTWHSDYDLLKRWVQTRQQQDALQRLHSQQHKGSISAKKAFGKNILSFDAEFNHNNSDDKGYNLFHLDYPVSGLDNDYRHRFNDKESKQYSINGTANYTIAFERGEPLTGWLKPFMKFRKDYTHSDNPLYRLDWAETDIVSDLVLLPTDLQVLLNTLDPANSFEYRQHINRFETGLDFRSDVRIGGKTWVRFNGKLPLEIWHGKLDYFRFNQPFHTDRTHRFVNLDLSARISLTPNDREGNKHTMSISYNIDNKVADLLNTLNFKDEANPLVITQGNPYLKNALTHNLKWEIKFEQQERMRHFSSRIHYAIINNAVGYERFYNLSTGVTTQTPKNIDGNWAINWANSFICPLKKNQQIILDGGLFWTYNHSKDLNTVYSLTETDKALNNNSVGTSQSKLRLRLLYKPTRKLLFNYQVESVWNNISGTRSDFKTINSYHINNVFSARMNLPCNFNFNSSLNVNSRYGFADKSLCKTYFLWNAKIERNLGKNITLSLESNDILHQNKGVSVVMDAQGRTETFREQTPPYVLLGFTWRFRKK